MGQQFRRCSVRFMLRLPSLQASWATNLDARAPGCRDLLPPGFRFASHLLEAPDNATGASRAIPRVGLAPTGCMALRAAPQTLLDYPDHTATLRALATEHHLPWPEHQEPAASDVLDRVAQFYADRLTVPVLRYLAERGFPETFVRQRRIGYAPISSSRDLLVREIRAMTKSNGIQLLQQAIEAGLVVRDKAGAVRDFFASETSGYILFPNMVHGVLWTSRAARIPRPPAAAGISTGRSRSTTCTMPAMPGSGP